MKIYAEGLDPQMNARGNTKFKELGAVIDN